MIYTINKTTQIDLIFKEDETVNIDIQKDSEGTLSLYAQGYGKVNLNITVNKNSNWKILWINNSDESLEIIENVNVLDHAHVKLIHGELSIGSHTKETKIHLLGEYSLVELTGAVLSFGKLSWLIQADHKAKNSEAHLNTNAIILDNGNLKLEVEGIIAKGYRGSKTHQMTRILNLGKQTKGIVFPKLLIDENDVEASHAASVGQANEEHIFYLQSRGLTYIEALRLMIMGYLAPVINEIEDKEIQENLMNKIEEKVNQYVH